MLKSLALCSLAALTMGAAMATATPSFAQMIRSDGYYSGQYDQDRYAHVHYRRVPQRDRDYYDRPMHSFDWPYGEGVSH